MKQPPGCWNCGERIVAEDDDALVCIDCGGRNRRQPYQWHHFGGGDYYLTNDPPPRWKVWLVQVWLFTVWPIPLIPAWLLVLFFALIGDHQ